MRERGARLYRLPSPRFFYSVYVPIAFSLGEYRVVDRSADTKWELQFTVYQCGSGQASDGVREEALLGDDLRQAAIVQVVRTETLTLPEPSTSTP